MKKHDERRSPFAHTVIPLTWPRAWFEAEARTDSRERHHPPCPRAGLKAGDRVMFDLGEAVDGPLYATNVRLIDRG